MQEKNVWKLYLYLHGKIEINGSYVDLDDITNLFPELNSIIRIEKETNPVKLSFSVEAKTQQQAEISALYIIGLLRDVICWRTNLPIEIGFRNQSETVFDGHSACYLTDGSLSSYMEIISYCRENPDFYPLLNAMSWYRKGLCSTDPVDKFTAYWMVLEILSRNYYKNTGKTQAKDPADKVNICFEHYAGDEHKRMISGRDWANEMYSMRCKIFHGDKALDAKSVETVGTELPDLQNRAHILLDIFGMMMLKNKLTWEGKSNQSRIIDRMTPK